MTPDPLTMVSGVNIIYAPEITIRQPRLRDISEPRVGQRRYEEYVRLLSLEPDALIPPEIQKKMPSQVLSAITSYGILTRNPELRESVMEALSFFIIEPVSCGGASGQLMVGARELTSDDFDGIRKIILRVCCAATDDVGQTKFKSEKARKIFEKIHTARKKVKKASDAKHDLPNVISALCAKHPSLNLTNVWGLTVWQLYNQFTRISINNQVDVMSQRWAAWGKDSFDFELWMTPTGE